jgi:hypothetical protein
MEAKNKTNVLANRNKPLWLILSLVGLLFISTQASAHYFGASNPWGKKRTLCYRLLPSVAQDPNWPGWIQKAIDNWNAISNKTGWKFDKCPEGQKADFDFGFVEPEGYQNQLNRRNNGQAPGGITASQTGTPLADATESIKIVKDIDKFSTNGQVVQGGVSGWDTKDGSNGEKRLDPVLVIMHELTHIMLLDHIGGCSTVDFEQPVCAGDHVTRTVSLSDINEIRFGLGNVPIETVTPPALPPCFANADAKKEFLAALKAKIDAIKVELKKASEQLAEDTKGGPPGNAAELEKWAANKARLEFEIAQDNSNVTVLQNRYDEAEALGLCGHAMRSITGQPSQFELSGSLGTAIATSRFVNTGNFSAGSEDEHTDNTTNTRGADFSGGLGASMALGVISLPGNSLSTLALGIDANFNAFAGGERTVTGIPGGPFGTDNGDDTFKINDNYLLMFGGWLTERFASGWSLSLTGGLAEFNQTLKYNCDTFCAVTPAVPTFTDSHDTWRTGGYVGGRVAIPISLPGFSGVSIGLDYKHVFLPSYTTTLGGFETRLVSARVSPAMDLVMLRLAVPVA